MIYLFVRLVHLVSSRYLNGGLVPFIDVQMQKQLNSAVRVTKLQMHLAFGFTQKTL